VATLTVTSLTAGSNTVSASYGGDAVFASSNALAYYTVSWIPTTLALNATASATVVGQPVTLTATLSPYAYNGQSSNGESITFINILRGIPATLGTGKLSGGVATLTLSSLPAGTYTLEATYGGDSYLQGEYSNQLSLAVS
jgi:hypothetical protein